MKYMQSVRKDTALAARERMSPVCARPEDETAAPVVHRRE